MSGTVGNITIRFVMPQHDLAPYITTYYYTRIEPCRAGTRIEDYLHPEWGNLRFVEPGMSRHVVGQGELVETPAFVAAGPSSVATRFEMGIGRSWGIGLLPLGWARFVDGSAEQFADRSVDGAQDRAFAAFAGLAEELARSDGSFESEVAIVERQMNGLMNRPPIDELPIRRLNDALVDSELRTVTDLAERTGMNIRSLERLSRRAFGFPPKLLLRRQRFLRSLAQFMLDPSLKWLSAMDHDYHDQAHFVRDFRRFMGMTPTAYGKLDHPLLGAAARARASIAGEAVQGLHRPVEARDAGT